MDLVIYQDLAGEWRWRIVAENGRIVADSAEAHVSKSNAVRAARRLVAADLTIVTGDDTNPTPTLNQEG